jgi:predicted RNase H-like HicB family nuclease
MSGYVVVIEQGDTSFGAYSPDLPGCVAVGDTVEEVEQRMREGIALHVENLRAHGEAVPKPRTSVRYMAVS